jgi:hypothetical protein
MAGGLVKGRRGGVQPESRYRMRCFLGLAVKAGTVCEVGTGFLLYSVGLSETIMGISESKERRKFVRLSRNISTASG